MVRSNGNLLRGIRIRIAGHKSLGDIEDADRDFTIVVQVFLKGSADLNNPSELIEVGARFGGHCGFKERHVGRNRDLLVG